MLEYLFIWVNLIRTFYDGKIFLLFSACLNDLCVELFEGIREMITVRGGIKVTVYFHAVGLTIQIL